MLLLLAALLCAVLWGFFAFSPKGVGGARLLACNAGVILAGIAAALGSALPLHADALAQHPDKAFMALYLAIMAGGAALMIVVALGGLVRNYLLFPLSRRAA
jgi:hypothetical protein